MNLIRISALVSVLSVHPNFTNTFMRRSLMEHFHCMMKMMLLMISWSSEKWIVLNILTMQLLLAKPCYSCNLSAIKICVKLFTKNSDIMPCMTMQQSNKAHDKCEVKLSLSPQTLPTINRERKKQYKSCIIWWTMSPNIWYLWMKTITISKLSVMIAFLISDF
jgi:hypothetical protein